MRLMQPVRRGRGGSTPGPSARFRARVALRPPRCRPRPRVAPRRAGLHVHRWSVPRRGGSRGPPRHPRAAPGGPARAPRRPPGADRPRSRRTRRLRRCPDGPRGSPHGRRSPRARVRARRGGRPPSVPRRSPRRSSRDRAPAGSGFRSGTRARQPSAGSRTRARRGSSGPRAGSPPPDQPRTRRSRRPRARGAGPGRRPGHRTPAPDSPSLRARGRGGGGLSFAHSRHLTPHPTGSVSAGSGLRPASTASRAPRSQAAPRASSW